MQHYENLKNIVASMEADVIKFSNGNASAGTRLRKTLQDLKKACQDFRVEIQNVKKTDK